MAASSWVTSKVEVKRVLGSEKSGSSCSSMVLSRSLPSSDPQLAHLEWEDCLPLKFIGVQ